MVSSTVRCCDVRHRLNTNFKVYYIVSRSLRCTFYKPEYDAVLKRYVELKKTNRPPALLAYMEERKEFVRQSFKVRTAEPHCCCEIADSLLSSAAMWMLGGANIRRRSKLRRRKPESTRTKTRGKGRICMLYMPVRSFTTHGHVSVHAKLARAGYSAIDFPFWVPEWEKTVTKHVNLTDKYTVAGSSPRVPTDHFYRLGLENVPKVERDD